MIKIYTYSHNRPDLIEPQYDSLKKHVKDNFEFIVFNNERGYQVSWFPWAPLSKDKDFYLPAGHVLTAYDPLDSISEQYIQAIKEENYDENFKKHEEVMAGVEGEDIDMEQIFKDAEAILDDEET